MTRTVLRRDCLYMLEKVRRAGDRHEKKMREAKMVLTPLSAKEVLARTPIRPEILANALQTSPHKEIGKRRLAKAIRAKKGK